MSLLIRRCYLHTSGGLSNAYRACLGKIRREKFIRQYNIKMMTPDGSLITARVLEPRYFLQMPVDLKSLNDDERRLRIASRKKKNIVVKDDIIQDNFDDEEYAIHWKNF